MSDAPIKPTFKVESISALHPKARETTPSEDMRMTRRVGDTVRLMVLVNGQFHSYPWVRITEVRRPVYVGVFECVEDSYNGVPNGAMFEFTADNMIDY
jgi:hypothetical protein